jgi:hypothetical protein
MWLPAWIVGIWLAGPYVEADRSAGPVHEGVPAALHVVMDGIILQRCDNNAALGCTELVLGPTLFPAFGTPQEQTAIRQAVLGFYADMDLVVFAELPPPYLPHLMAVVGGTSSLIGKEKTICGIATLSCGAEQRNLVSLTFAMSCGGPESTTRVASVLAQEVGHNLGLEHTSSWTDLMFPTINENEQSFEDLCNDVLTPEYDDNYRCPDVHLLDCPDGDGGLQNTHAELLRLLGPRRNDSEAPQILATEPEDGATLSASDTIVVSASVTDDSQAIGLRWSWLEGPASADGEPGLTRCTNDACDRGYEPWKPIDSPWPFLELVDPAAGTYLFSLEVTDMHGNHAERSIRFDVVGEGTDDAADGSGEDGSEGESSADGDVVWGDESAACACRARGLPLGMHMIWLLFLAPRGRRRT